MTVLVTGGAGYIGSHAVYALLDRGDKVVVLDDLSTGAKAQVGEKAAFVQGDVADTALVRKIIADRGVDSVIHFAGSIVVPDSVADPLGYYENNVVKSRALIQACIAGGVKHFIFSSTAAVYDADAVQPLGEGAGKRPISPYARSKLMTEWMLEDVSHAYPMRHTVLRYFNVAGADPQERTGQSTPKATHLIKRAAQVVLGRVPHLDMFGTDYPTRDGTCVRDYVHVSDLADAHVLGVRRLLDGKGNGVFCLGTGRGFSVREVIEASRAVTNREVPVVIGERRAGDAAALVSSSTHAIEELGWEPRHSTLRQMIGDAWAWAQKPGFAE